MTFVTQTNPDYYYEPCNEKNKRINLNPRYSYFRQNYYTTGDVDQFLQNWRVLHHDSKTMEISTTHVELPQQIHWKKYCDLTVYDYYNTFQYIHEKFKKGCFLQFHENHLKTFLPFSKQSFRNEWGGMIKFDPRFGTIHNMMKYIAKFDLTFPYDAKRINKDVYAWYGNNGLVRFEYPLSENDTGYNMLKDMFETLCRERDVPDIEIFLGKRDHPWLRMDGTESYDVFFGDQKRLLSHNYQKYAPIISMNSTDHHADIPIPTWEDWSRVAYQEDGKLFSKDFTTYPTLSELESTTWENKIPTAVFRGTSTGRGTTVKNNVRLFFSKMSLKMLKDSDGNLLIDAGITKWNLRPRKSFDSPYLSTILLDEIGIPLSSYMSPLEQSKYKYILHLPGHTAAYRLSLEMFYGSVILLYPSVNYLWFFKMLKPWVHYIPLSSELSETDIFEKLDWCKNHDDECKQIAENASLFAKKYLTKDGILNYLQALFWSLSSNNISPKYHPHSELSIQQHFIHDFVRTHQDSLLRKQIAFLPDLYEMFLGDQHNIFSSLKNNPIFFSHLFSYLDKNKRLEGFLKETLENSEFYKAKNSEINLYNFHGKKWISKRIKSTWKKDELHQLFVGLQTTNELSLQIPNFVYTYFFFQDLNRTLTKSNVNIFLEYKDSLTLDKLIRQKKISLSQLIQIWTQICLILEEAQQHSGFIHMDLYPWNILIEEKNVEVVYLNKYHLKTKLNPILIDYGNSHIVYQGQHFYTTTPFQFNRFQDVMCMIFSSLDVFLQTSTLSGQDTQKCFKVMNFFAKSSLFGNDGFESISQMKRFIRENKKFSVMLSSPKSTFYEFRPLFFFDYINKMNLLSGVMDFSIKTSSKINSKTFFLYSSDVKYYAQTLFILNDIDTKTIPSEDIAIWYRRLWIQFFEQIKSYDMDGDFPLAGIYIKDFISYYSISEKLFYKRFGHEIWKVPKQLSCQLMFDRFYSNRTNIKSVLENAVKNVSVKCSLPNLPLLNTHSCFHSDKNSSTNHLHYYQMINYLYLIRNSFHPTSLENYDFFKRRCYKVEL